MKKLALIFCMLAGPALAQEPAKPQVWLLTIQLKATTVTVTYPTEDACKAGLKVTGARIKQLGLGRADCLPVVQP